MRATEHTRRTPSAETGCSAALAGVLRFSGSGAPVGARAHALASLLGFSLLALLAVTVPAPASAAITHPFQFSFDGHETPAGSFGEAQALAVDQATGDVYVLDVTNNVVDKFKPNGEYVCQITGAGSATTSASECDSADPGAPAGAFRFLTRSVANGTVAVAVDNDPASPNFGDLYVGNQGTDEVQEFKPPAGGEYSLAFQGQTTSVSGTGNLTAGSKEVTGVSTSQCAFFGVEVFFEEGEGISGPGIPAGTTIEHSDGRCNGGKIGLSKPATETATGVHLTANLLFSATASQVEKALQPEGSHVSFRVKGPAGGPFTIEFVGIFTNDPGLQITPSAGSVSTVTEGVAPYLERFGPSGGYLGQVPGPAGEKLEGIAAASAGNLWASFTAESAPLVYGWSPGGTLRSKFNVKLTEVGQPFAVDSNEDLYVGLSGETNAVKIGRFNGGGEELGFLLGCGPPHAAGQGCVSGSTVDLSTDQVYLDENTGVAEYGPAYEPEQHQLVEFGSEQMTGGTHEDGAVAVNALSGAVYVASATDRKVYVYASPGPRVLPEPASEVKTTTASLNAEVNPVGSQLTECVFEYGTQAGAYNHSVLCAQTPAQIGSGTAYKPLSAPLENLRGSTTYHYRVVVANANGGPLPGADRHFTTEPAAAIDEAKAIEVRETSAVLTAKVNPNGLEVQSCVFEYGTQAGGYSLGKLPCEPAHPTGTSDVLLSAHLAGLSPNTTYHWRLLATDANSTTTGIDHTFIYIPAEPRSCPNEALRTGLSASLPDCRAYEQVSPTAKNGALLSDTFTSGHPPYVSPDGSRVIATAVQCFAAAEGCTAVANNRIGTPYQFARTEGGWRTTPLEPSAARFATSTPVAYTLAGGTPLFSAPAQPGGVEHFYWRLPDASLTDVGPVLETAKPESASSVTAYASADRSRLIWIEAGVGEPWPSLEPLFAGNAKAYEYAGAGNSKPLLVAVSDHHQGGTSLISTCGLVPSANAGQFSEDGRTFYFTAGGAEAAQHPCMGTGENEHTAVPVDELFARIDNTESGARTVAISEPSPSECGAGNQAAEEACRKNTGEESGFRSAQFEGASSDGSRVFFVSPQQLTDEATQAGGAPSATGCADCNLYLFEDPQEKPPLSGHHLIDVSAGDTSGAGPRVQGTVAISPDGSHVYFVARGVLAANENGGGESARAGAFNLYVYERDGAHPQGHTTFIAALPASDLREWRPDTARLANVTPDGRFLLFTSHAALTPDDTSQSAAAQVYRYDASTGVLVRISVGERGFNDGGNRSTPTPCEGVGCSEDATIVNPNTAAGKSSMSGDGSFVFFQSAVALAPGALDDQPIGTGSSGLPEYAQNVYEWHAGHVSLISDGHDVTVDGGQSEQACAPVGTFTSRSSVCLLGTDATGENVFFSTADQLTSSDTDTELDYYDARVNGGFPAPVAAHVCVADECHPSPAVPPVFGPLGSLTFAGPGNVIPEVVGTGPPKPRTAEQVRVEKVAKALRLCRSKHDRHRRSVCEAQARRRYAKPKRASHTTGRAR